MDQTFKYYFTWINFKITLNVSMFAFIDFQKIPKL